MQMLHLLIYSGHYFHVVSSEFILNCRWLKEHNGDVSMKQIEDDSILYFSGTAGGGTHPILGYECVPP